MHSHRFPGGKTGSRNVVAILALLFSVPLQATPGWDIVGLRLGMTEAEILSALKAHAPDAQITTKSLKFTYNDGAQQKETEPFTARLDAVVRKQAMNTEVFNIELSAPPLEQRAIKITRNVTNYNEPPALDRVLESITQKYGKPATTWKYGQAVVTTELAWTEAGRPVCGKSSKSTQLPQAVQAPDGLRWYETQRKANTAPADGAQCSPVLRAQLATKAGGSSVSTLKFEMVDPGLAVPAMTATATWLDELEGTARKARLEGGVVPEL